MFYVYACVHVYEHVCVNMHTPKSVDMQSCGGALCRHPHFASHIQPRVQESALILTEALLLPLLLVVLLAATSCCWLSPLPALPPFLPLPLSALTPHPSRLSPLASRRSPLASRLSPLASRLSPLASRHLVLAVRTCGAQLPHSKICNYTFSVVSGAYILHACERPSWKLK